jgi:hypothetical protein
MMLDHGSNGGRARCCLALCFCFVLVGALHSSADGRPIRLGKVPGRYGCGTCHIAPRGGGPRTLFGKEWERIAIKAGDTLTAELEGLDSDGDGFTNAQEFEAGTHPGRVGSKPES